MVLLSVMTVLDGVVKHHHRTRQNAFLATFLLLTYDLSSGHKNRTQSVLDGFMDV